MRGSAYAIIYALVGLAIFAFVWSILPRPTNIMISTLPTYTNASDYYGTYSSWVANFQTFYGYLYWALPLIVTVGAVIYILTLANVV